MPLSNFQKEVLKLLATNRNPDSYVAGGIAINRERDSLRFSKDVDIFHHLEESVRKSFEEDYNTLKNNGYGIILQRKEDALIKAQVVRGDESLRLEWVRDSAFRFFPVVQDPGMGYRLHDIDLATNKCLALANRNEVRDVLDMVQIHDSFLSLAANVWAACGKDPGFSPGLMLNQLSRNSRIYPEDLESEELVRDVNPQEIKIKWLKMLDTARATIEKLPAEDLGCLYLKGGQPVREIDVEETGSYERHYGSVLGSWPRMSGN